MWKGTFVFIGQVQYFWPACLLTPLKRRDVLTDVSEEDTDTVNARAYLECLLWIIELQLLKERPCHPAVSLSICCLQAGIHALSAQQYLHGCSACTASTK